MQTKMEDFFSSVAKGSFIFKYETQSNNPKKLGKNSYCDPLAQMNILMMSEDFVKEVPILFGINSFSKEDILRSNCESKTEFVK